MSKRIRPSKEWMIDQYVTQNVSADAIAQMFGAAECTVHGWLRFYDIPTKKETAKFCNELYGDKTGQKIGRLLVLGLDESPHPERKGRFWICRCDCGNTISADSSLLGHKKSCGCLLEQPDKRLEGQKFDRVLVLREIGRNKRNERRYECQCDCGKTWKVDGSSLRAGRVVSCGCKRNEGARLRRGPKSPNWKPEISQEERVSGRNRNLDSRTIEWRKAVFSRDDYTCQISSRRGNDLVAHHIVPWIDSKDLRFVLSSGITMHRYLHVMFHRVYGYKNNTLEQISEFKATYGVWDQERPILEHLTREDKGIVLRFFKERVK